MILWDLTSADSFVLKDVYPPSGFIDEHPIFQLTGNPAFIIVLGPVIEERSAVVSNEALHSAKAFAFN